MVNLELTQDDLLLIAGVKEAQIFQQARQIDKLNAALTRQLQINSELLKDRDMDALELQDLRTKIARVTMMAEKF